MIKMTIELFEKFSNKQNVLDTAIKEKFNIDADTWMEGLHENHKLALRGEVAEFINEARDHWKYWKQEEVEHEKLIDEAVDVIHFIHLIVNKKIVQTAADVNFINQRIEKINEVTMRVSNLPGQETKRDLRRFISDMYNVETLEDILTTYAILLFLLDQYGYKLEDIEAAYDKKNKVNHERQQQGY